MPGQMLLIEDDPNDIELMQLALETSGLVHHLDIVSDGEAALQYLGIHDQPAAIAPTLPQLVLLDLKLPKLNGFQVLQAIRQHPSTRRLIVVVMTSSQEDTDINTCYSLGINSYIVKPLNYQQFLEVTQSISHYWLNLNQPPALFSA